MPNITSLFTRPLGRQILEPEVLRQDKKNCRKIGPCGIGEKALYLNSFYIDRMYYVPIQSVRRVFKRVAMSRGGFTGKGVFASIPYLVVEYDNGQEKQCNFKYEEKVDQFLQLIHERYPGMPVHSRKAQQRLHEKELASAKKRRKDLSEEEKDQMLFLHSSREYLCQRPQLWQELSSAAKAKRANERSNPAYRWAALFIVLLGLGAAAFGIRSLFLHEGAGVYFLLFGLAAVFLFSGANVLPTRQNNKAYIEERLRKAEQDVESYLRGFPGFPVPPRYAHPIVLEWMEEALAEGRAKNCGQALAVVKQDLKALNSDVTVEEEEYTRIMAVKPMFLVHDYA